MTRQGEEIERIYRWACMLLTHDRDSLDVLRMSIGSAYDGGYIDGTNKERDAAANGLARYRMKYTKKETP